MKMNNRFSHKLLLKMYSNKIKQLTIYHYFNTNLFLIKQCYNYKL